MNGFYRYKDSANGTCDGCFLSRYVSKCKDACAAVCAKYCKPGNVIVLDDTFDADFDEEIRESGPVELMPGELVRWNDGLYIYRRKINDSQCEISDALSVRHTVGLDEIELFFA